MLMQPETRERMAAAEQSLRQLREVDAAWAGPAPGSAMAHDDAIWRPLPCSEVVRAAMLSAHEHLDLVHQLLVDHTRPPSTAVHSALRGALLGSCLALWVAGCEDNEQRRGRALALVAEDYKYRREFHESQTCSVDPERAAHARPWVERWRQRQEELEIVRAEFPRLNAGKVTPIIKWVAREMFGESADAYALLVGLFQSSSSTAHGYGWGAFVRPGLTSLGHDPGRGLSAFEAAVDVNDAAEDFLLCASLLRLADGLFRQHSSAT